MMDSLFIRCLLTGAIWIGGVHAGSVASSCSTTLKADTAMPSVAHGYVARLVAQDLTNPRGIKFDNEGHLLVVEQEVGITAITFEDAGNGCITQSNRKTVVTDDTLNHGIEVSEDGKTLYASSTESAFSWDYDAGSQSISKKTTIVNNMYGTDHDTRTLLLSRKVPGMMVISRGSLGNIDLNAADKSTGVSQVKAFDLNKLGDKPYNYVTEGKLLGWGLRNEVGIGEQPTDGGIWGVENSADSVMRDNVNVHNTNPAEELNFLGYLDGTPSSNQGRNFGYPDCYTAWNTSVLKLFTGNVGQQFAVGNFSKNQTVPDAMCSEAHYQTPRLPFHPHMAPLDIKFNDEGDAGWVSFHGSWDSYTPVGYKVSVVKFANGQPTEPSTSMDVTIDIFEAHDVTGCKVDDGVTCIRPVGLAWDSKGNLFMSSDMTGEIWVILRADGKPTISTKGAPGKVGHSSTKSTASSLGVSSIGVLAVLTTVFAFLV